MNGSSRREYLAVIYARYRRAILQHAISDALVRRKIRARLGGCIQVMFSGAAPLSAKLAEFFFAVGLPVYEGYSSSAAPAAH
jgi:long-chain acyl-CoA synthetase